MVVVRDPNGHFVELFSAARSAGPGDARVRLTVSNLDRAIALYQDAFGLRGAVRGFANADPSLMRLFGVDERAKVRLASLEVPGSPVILELVEFSGVDRRTVNGAIQDPGSTRMQLQVRDLDAAIQAVVRAGGSVISTGGKPVELPAGRGAAIRAAMVRDPDNLFLVLIQSRPQP
jgi:predicted enzyme related to lactoylglutathione lyase